MNINEVPILLHTMDSYSNYWDNWYFLFKKNCDNHGPIYFLTEEKEPSFVNEVIHIKSGKGEWGQRLLNGLSHINSDILFYMQEDFWVTRKMKFSNHIIETFNKYDMDCLKFNKNSFSEISFFHVEKNLYRYSQNSRYTLSHQFGLWKKDVFISLILPNENPWENEINGTKRLNKRTHKIYQYDTKWYDAVCRHGQLQENGYKVLKDYGLKFDDKKIKIK